MVMPVYRLVSMLWLAAVVLPGCGAKKPVDLAATDRLGDVGMIRIEAPESQSYPVESDQTWQYASPWDDNLPPTYPESLLARRLPPTRVKVRMIVDETGRVTSVEPLDPAGTADPAFLAAVQSALKIWTFRPLLKVEPKKRDSTTLVFHGIQMTLDGLVTPLPYHEDYEFAFTQRDGIGYVSTRR
jgi:TonB family protein